MNPKPLLVNLLIVHIRQGKIEGICCDQPGKILQIDLAGKL